MMVKSEGSVPASVANSVRVIAWSRQKPTAIPAAQVPKRKKRKASVNTYAYSLSPAVYFILLASSR